MPRFFIAEDPKEFITVTGGDAQHISRSLRMKTGDEIVFCRMGTDFCCRITSISETQVTAKVLATVPCSSEPTVFLTLYQAMPKGDKLSEIIQKTVELGISRITPFISKRCVSRPSKDDFAKKLKRYNKISEEAAKQSGRGIIPEVTELMTFEESLSDMLNSETRIICYENGGENLEKSMFQGIKKASFMIGSEGGLTRDEAEAAVKQGITPVWLGERILRCETAPIAVTAVIMNLTGNL